MTKDILDKFCVRVRIYRSGILSSHGSGVLLKYNGESYVLTAYHCIFGAKNEFEDVVCEEISLESQEAFNTPFNKMVAQEIYKSDKNLDWALVKINQNSADDLPQVYFSHDFNVNLSVNFRGFQQGNPDESRTFDSTILDKASNGEFKIKLSQNDHFKGGADDAKGLSGSGVFIIKGERLYLSGIVKSVKGDEALNDDIKCCSISCLFDIMGDGFATNMVGEEDLFAIDEFDKIVVTDNRDIIDKIKAVCSQISQARIDKYCRDLSLGKIELSYISEREMSAIKFRIFEECQEELVNFLETRSESNLLASEITELLNRFTERAVAIVSMKANKFNYPELDQDNLKKVVLDLINECYLSFDKEGLYE